MRKKMLESWVVFLMPLHSNKQPARAVCSQGEWEELEAAQPGFHTMLQGGITNEAEAERLARGTLGDAKVRRI